MSMGAYLSKQIQNFKWRVGRRISRASRKEVPVRDDETEPVWDQSVSPLPCPRPDNERMKMLKKDLAAAKSEEKHSTDAKMYEYDEKNLKSMFDVMKHVQKKMGGAFMSQGPFYDWMNER